MSTRAALHKKIASGAQVGDAGTAAAAAAAASEEDDPDAEPEPEPYYTDPYVLYAAGPQGEGDSYIFPAGGDSSCIIDFSRVILGPDFRSKLELGRSPQYATNFYRDQVSRVMQAFHRYAPDYVTMHQDKIQFAIINDFESVFPVLCAIDYIAIGASLSGVLTRESLYDGPCVREAYISLMGIEIATKLEITGRRYLILGLRGLVAGRKTTNELPGLSILKDVFEDWHYPTWAIRNPELARSVQLVDAYNHENPVKYSGSDYDSYPPWARLDVIEPHLDEGLKIEDLFDRDIEPFLSALTPNPQPEIISAQTQAETDKLDGLAVDIKASWLND